jgi:hypothetical protein
LRLLLLLPLLLLLLLPLLLLLGSPPPTLESDGMGCRELTSSSLPSLALADRAHLQESA